MAMRMNGCPICYSDKIYGRPCQHCNDRDAEADAIHQAHRAYASDQIDIEELEQRIHIALTNPPTPSYSGIILRFR